MVPRFGKPVDNKIRYRHRPGVYALLLQGDSVLLTHQSEPEPELQLPGGGIDPGEQTLPALHREVREETGWTMRINRRLGAYRLFTFMPDYDLWAEKLCTIYLAHPVRSLGPPTESTHTPIWAPLSDVPDLLGSPGDRAFVRNLLKP